MFIKNNVKHDMLFKVVRNNKVETFVFESERRYADSGNIAQTGVTNINDGDYEWLKDNCKQFAALLNKGELKVSKTDGAAEVAGEINELKDENEKLRVALEKKTAEAATATNETTESLKNENAELKAKIEALIKGEKVETVETTTKEADAKEADAKEADAKEVEDSKDPLGDDKEEKKSAKRGFFGKKTGEF